MKNYFWPIIASIILITFTCCNDSSTQTEPTRINGYTVDTIQGCEYFMYYGPHHKGNCKNPIHTKYDTTIMHQSHDTMFITTQSYRNQ